MIFGNPTPVLLVIEPIWASIRWLRYLVLPLVLVAGYAASRNWTELGDSMSRVFATLSFAQSMLLGLLTTNFLGRTAKAVALTGYGLPPHQFGIRLLFGIIPRFYYSSRGIRSLPFPDQRRCYSAALLMRLFLFGTGVLGWTILYRNGSFLAELSLAFGITGLTVFLFTANPIWRADGYRWVTAFFERPKMRSQGQKLLWMAITRRKRPDAMPAGEARLLILFALASIIYMALFVWVILSTAAIMLEAQFNGTGVVMFCLIIGIAFFYMSSMRAGQKKRKEARAKAREAAVMASQSAPASYTLRSAPVIPETETRLLNKAPEPIRKDPDRETPVEDAPDATPKVDLDLEAILPAAGAAAAAEAQADDELLRLLDETLDAPLPTDEARDGGPDGAPDSQDDRDAKAPPPLPPAKIATVPARVEDRALAPRPAPPTPAPAQTDIRPSDQLDRVLGVGTAKRKKPSLLRRLIIWSVLIGILVVAGLRPYSFTVGGEFIVQPVARTQVRARTDGEIIERRVQEGDWVSTGTVLAVLSTWDEERDISVLSAELEKQRADLATLTAGPKTEEVLLSQQSLAAAAAEKAAADEELARAQQLFQSGTIARSALSDAETRNLIAAANLERAEAALALLQAPVLQSELDAARAAIARTQEQLNFYNLKLEHTNIRAVSDGQIGSPLGAVSVGAFLKEGDLFAEMADSRVVLAEIEVPETEIDEVDLGLEVTLKPWSAPTTSLIGTVQRIAPAAEEREFGRIMRVIVEVPNPDGTLAGNMTGFAKITVDERPAWRAFTRVFIRFFQVELWSWLP